MQMLSFQFTMNFCVGCSLIIGYLACICKACLRQAFFFNNTRVGCPCRDLACHHASSFGFALSHLVWFCLTRIQRHSVGFTIIVFFSDASFWSVLVSRGFGCIHLSSLHHFFFGCLAYPRLLCVYLQSLPSAGFP